MNRSRRFTGPAPLCAAIDLGTNSCRLLIADMTKGDSAARDLRIIDSFSRVVRLGDGVVETGFLSSSAQDRTIRALDMCARKMRRHGVTLSRGVATAACRRARNGQAFVERVQDETGVVLDIISCEEEVRLAVWGCRSFLKRGQKSIVFDIGGGSTEVALVEVDDQGGVRVIDWVSVGWGVVSLVDVEMPYLTRQDTRQAAYERMRARVYEGLCAFRDAIAPLTQVPFQLLGGAGTVTTLAALYLGLPHYDRRRVDGCLVPCATMRDIARDLVHRWCLTQFDGGRQQVGQSGLFLAGCAIVESLFDLWPTTHLRVVDRGLREGILRQLVCQDRR